MVTASHNPPRDNGYKVYLGGRMAADSGRGVQIVPPSDAEIAARIGEVESVAGVPRAGSGWTCWRRIAVARGWRVTDQK